MTALELTWDREKWTIQLSDSAELVRPRYELTRPAGVESPGIALRKALEHPLRFEPLRRALTPEDRVTVAIESTLGHKTALLRELIAYLGENGIAEDRITLLLDRGEANELKTEFPALTIESHQPGDREKLGYLASTQKERRIYLNRLLSEADQAIVIAERGYDCLFGQTGPENLIFPALADSAVQKDLRKNLRADCPVTEPWPLLEESREVAWLLGIPFLIHVMLDDANAIVDIQAGIVESAATVAEQFDGYSRGLVPESVDAAILTFEASTADFGDIAQALLSVSRVVDPNGIIAVVCNAALSADYSVRRIRSQPSARAVLKHVATMESGDPKAVFAWASAVRDRRIYLVSDLTAEASEGLFATKLESAAQLERLLQSSKTVLHARNAHRKLFEIG